MVDMQTSTESNSKRRMTGFGVDADFAKRPGVPMEVDPRPAEGSHWDEPERQKPRNEKLKRQSLEQLTPVYGTAVPPRGLSGILRRAAYEVPEYRARHWLYLLVADRIDVIEGKILDRKSLILSAVAVVGVGLFAMNRQKRGSRLNYG